MSRRFLFLMIGMAVAATTMTAAADTGEHEVDFGLRAGYYAGTDGPFVGLEVAFPFVPLLYFNPNTEAAFGDYKDTYSLNADAYLEIPVTSPAHVWFGGGPAVLIRNYTLRPPHYRSDDVNLGFNVLTGVGWRSGTGPMFYFQGKVVITSDVEAVFGLGLRF